MNRAGDFVSKQKEIEGIEFGPVRNFQEQDDEHVGFGKIIMGFRYN